MPFRIARIVSGGQTGVDRAALDVAIARDIPHGGWCPQGRRAERTEQNVVGVRDVAGPRESTRPGISGRAAAYLDDVLTDAAREAHSS